MVHERLQILHRWSSPRAKTRLNARISTTLSLICCLALCCLSSTAASTTTTTTSATATSATSATPTTANQDETEEVKQPKNFGHSSTVVSKSNCKIKCLDPHAFSEESADLVQLEQKIYLAYSDRDVEFISKHLADDCITFYEGDQKVVSGKQAALEDIKDWMNRDEKTDSPMLEIVIEHPYCNIKDGNATVIFTALKEIGGAHPGKFKSHVTDVFKKEGSFWLLLNHYRTSWREIN